MMDKLLTIEAELKRLDALYQTQLLDTPREERFDRITRMAKRTFGVPIAMINLVDTFRVWPKSIQGLDITELPRLDSFCSYTILSEKPFIVPDTQLNPRFCDTSLVVAAPYIRFYAGIALKGPDGSSKIGTLALIDFQPRLLDPNTDIPTFRDLATMVEVEIQNISLNEAVAKYTQTERALQKSEERYRAVAELTSDYIWSAILQPDGQMQIEWAAGAFEVITGYTPQELADLGGWAAIVHPEHLKEMMEGMGAVFSGQTTVGEFRIIKKAGEVRWLRFYSRPRWDATSGRVCGFIGATQDITERKLIEEALQQSEANLRQVQKMEAIGRMAGSIAHDFNNLISAILNYSDFVLMSLGEDNDSIKEDVAEIKKAGERAAALTHQLLAFSRQQVLQPKLINLNRIVEEIQKLLRHLISENIELVTLTEAELPDILADAGQIEQVIVNLAVNARDAMPEGGKLILETKNVQFSAGQHPYIQPGLYVLLKVSDTGCGIPENLKNKIFEPFFTTKEPGQGTGLGLATVYGIVKQSDGYIEVESQDQIGTVFSVYLPKRDNIIHTDLEKEF